ncbi:MAG: metallophosphoesterase [Nitrososphaeraceae archaeon]|nr:metallophosphoesterase [Nitrososphaeraceae archaeon]
MSKPNTKVPILFFIFLLLSIHVSLQFAFSKNDDFFELHIEQYYDPNDYIENASSIESENSGSENFKTESTLDKEQIEQHGNFKNLSNFNIAVVGDWGCTKYTKKTVNSIQNHKPELVFNLGDASYAPDLNCWIKIVEPISNKMYSIVGNHDYISSFIFKQYKEYTRMPDQYYSFDYKNVHFLMMSSEISYKAGKDSTFSDVGETEQYEYVDKDLSQASKNPDIKWIIVMIHRQQYSSLCGDHDSCDPIKKLRDTYHPLFEKYGVDFLFSGHAHNYQRTYPISYNEINPFQPIINNNGKTEYISPEGMIQLIVGTGGIDFDGFSSHEPFIAFQQDSNFGFLNLDFQNDRNRVVGKFYSNDDEVLDEFKITK